jgi:hypothetical protein
MYNIIEFVSSRAPYMLSKVQESNLIPFAISAIFHFAAWTPRLEECVNKS